MDILDERPFDTYAEYRSAVIESLQAARQTVDIFDPDLAECGLESLTGIALLEGLCAGSRQRDSLRILVHATTCLEQECPRLVGLCARHAHCVAVRTTDAGAKAWTQPFLIADGETVVTRFHQDLPRGKTCTAGSTTVATLRTQFETMWRNGEPCNPGIPLGI